MKTISYVALLLLVILAVAGCAITNKYGPYMGKVVDVETGEPIEGAVVFIRFFTEMYGSPGGPVSYFADAVEVLTDKNGDFYIPAHRIFTFRPLSLWEEYETVIVFKPGYGAFPKHPRSDRDHHEEEHVLPKNINVIVRLPKLKTVEERKNNLGFTAYDRSRVPNKKQSQLLKLINFENRELGLDEVGIPPRLR